MEIKSHKLSVTTPPSLQPTTALEECIAAESKGICDSTQPVSVCSHNVRVPGFTAVDRISILSLPLKERRCGNDTWEDGEIHYSVPAFLIEQSGTMITIVTVQTRDFYRLTNFLLSSASKM